MSPFAGFIDFEDCVNQNQDKDDPEAFCSFLQMEAGEKEKENKDMDEIFENLVSGPLVIKSAHKQIVTAPVLVPGERDADGEVVTIEKIEDVALKYLEDFGIVDVGHTFNPVATPVENWLTRNDETHVLPSGEKIFLPAGTWMLSAKIKNQNVWSSVMKGELTGFSVTGVRKSDIVNAMKSEEPIAAVKSVIDAAMKRKTLLADLGDDWLAATVAIVKDPAVFKSKWLAIKAKVENEDDNSKSLFSTFIAKLTKKSKEDEMKEEEVKALVEAAIKEAKTEIAESLKPLEGIQEAVKSMGTIGDRLTVLEDASKKSNEDSKEDNKSDEDKEDKKSDESSEETKALKAQMEEMAKTIEGLSEKIAPKSKALNEQEGEEDKDISFKGKKIERDMYGRRM